MLVRTLAALVVVAVFGNGLFAHGDNASVKVGDHLFIRMTGDLAKEYARRTGLLRDNEAPDDVKVEISATIAQKLDNGRIRIEDSSFIKRDGKQDRLITLTATVDRTKVTTDVTPKGTPIYASPAAHKNGTKPTLTTEDTNVLRLHLSDLKGLKLRTWTLAEEIGE